MAGVTGLEPAASGVTGRRSNQLSYTPAKRDAQARGKCVVYENGGSDGTRTRGLRRDRPAL